VKNEAGKEKYERGSKEEREAKKNNNTINRIANIS